MGQNRFADLTAAATVAANQSEANDGITTMPTSVWEALERAIHNVAEGYRPSHPDSSALRCHWACGYCVNQDAAQGHSGNTQPSITANTPAWDATNWAALERAMDLTGHKREDCSAFMFMQESPAGVFQYKHRLTRNYASLRVDSTAEECREALRKAEDLRFPAGSIQGGSR